MEDLSDRTETQIEYDELVLAALRTGENIAQALQLAAAQHPAENWLIRSDEDLAILRKHYLSLAGDDDVVLKL